MNSAQLAKRLQGFRRAELLIDANLLVLYFIGARRPDLIASFSRTRRYTREDFEILEAFVLEFKRMTTTPHVLTEVSNLTGKLGEPLRSELRHWVAEVTRHWTERFTASKTLTQDTAFPGLGLTDVAIATSPSRMTLVLTDDFRLAGLLDQRGLGVIRFADLRNSFE